jgi:hypothetical protein
MNASARNADRTVAAITIASIRNRSRTRRGWGAVFI